MPCTDLWERSPESVFPSSSLWGFYLSSLSRTQCNSNNTNTFCAATLSTSKHFTNTGLDSVWSSTDINFLLKPWLCFSEWQISHCLQWGWDFTHSLSKNLGKANLLKEVNVIAEGRGNLSSFQGAHKFSKWRTGISRLLGEWQREESLTNYSSHSVSFS